MQLTRVQQFVCSVL